MSYINLFIIEGRLVKKPDVKILDSGKKFCKFKIAWNFTRKNFDGKYESDACFYFCEAFGMNAEKISNMDKGYLICVQGQQLQRTYKSQDNVNVVYNYISVEKLNLIAKPNETYNEQAIDLNIGVPDVIHELDQEI